MMDWNYTAPKEAVAVLKKYALKKNLRILDAGCGTGLVGIELKKFGYSCIEGVDFSPKYVRSCSSRYLPKS